MSAMKHSTEQIRKSAAERLDKYSHRVPFSSCIYWVGAISEHGYGVMGIGRSEVYKAHRVAYQLHKDLPFSRGSHADVYRHSCDNPACVNPLHIEPGTQIDNIHDTMNRDRIKFGSKHHGAKLSESDVLAILSQKGKRTQLAMARDYGVNPSVISRIFSGAAWRRVPAEGEQS